MPKKKWTDAERKAFAEKMKAARAQKQDDIRQNDDIEQLKKQLAELQAKMNLPQQESPVLSTKVVHTKYSFDPKIYPDPRARITAEEKLKPFAFDYHYEMNFDVKKVDSEEDGIKVRQPRFELELWQKVTNEDTNETKKYRRKKWMFFEDPDSYIAIANQQGIEVPEHLEKDFLDEMRYLNFRDAVLEVFYPPKRTDVDQTREEVLGNQVLTVVTATADVGTGTPNSISSL